MIATMKKTKNTVGTLNWYLLRDVTPKKGEPVLLARKRMAMNIVSVDDDDLQDPDSAFMDPDKLRISGGSWSSPLYQIRKLWPDARWAYIPKP